MKKFYNHTFQPKIMHSLSVFNILAIPFSLSSQTLPITHIQENLHEATAKVSRLTNPTQEVLFFSYDQSQHCILHIGTFNWLNSVKHLIDLVIGLDIRCPQKAHVRDNTRKFKHEMIAAFLHHILPP